VNIPAKALKDPPDMPRDIRRMLLLGVLYGVLFLAGFALVVNLLGLPVE
jgi:hypothetical protein